MSSVGSATQGNAAAPAREHTYQKCVVQSYAAPACWRGPQPRPAESSKPNRGQGLASTCQRAMKAIICSRSSSHLAARHDPSAVKGRDTARLQAFPSTAAILNPYASELTICPAELYCLCLIAGCCDRNAPTTNRRGSVVPRLQGTSTPEARNKHKSIIRTAEE